jgi:hypothetical protein
MQTGQEVQSVCKPLVRRIEDLLHFHRVGIHMRAFVVVDHGILEHLVPILFEDLHRLVVRASNTLANSRNRDGLFDDLVIVGIELSRGDLFEQFATLATFLITQLLDCLLARLHDFAHSLANIFGNDNGGWLITPSTSLATFLRADVRTGGLIMNKISTHRSGPLFKLLKIVVWQRRCIRLDPLPFRVGTVARTTAVLRHLLCI